ncbi:MAG: 16S rRNA (guanine(527)-N(7))-methyltransferase RsmG [Alphaproteobacteria bacterium]|nr:16S rRNA (guanine(527)-N(7))-methyltransferase RsmG [Alphaproteobacteria bacterium]
MSGGEGPYGPLDFARDSEVPRETLERLTNHARLLVERNAHLNLVADSTLADMWRRHFLDSAQLVPLVPAEARTIVDLGSGAGFPGMVLAIMLAPDRPGLRVHLIDSTQKKCRFLEEVAEATGAPVEVHWSRAEDLSGLTADVVTARAVAPLAKLLGLAAPFFGEGTIGLFLKGRAAAAELTEARESWKLQVEITPSRSDPSGSILRVTGLMPWRKPRKLS